MLEIYYGDEKSRVRMCVGAAVQAALRERSVLLVSFTGDYAGYGRLFEITPYITRPNAQLSVGERELFDSAVRTALSFKYTVLILDGVFDAVENGRIGAAEAYEFLSNAPDSIEIICTGKRVDARFLSLADNAVRMSQPAETA